MLAAAIPIGLLIGLSLGALGGGGSVLTVPALVYLLHESPHAATAGSLLIVGVTALAGSAAHWRAGRVRVVPGLVFGGLGIAGSYVGSLLSAHVDADVLLTAFAVLMLVVAVAMLKRGSAAPSDPDRRRLEPEPLARPRPAGPRLPGPRPAGSLATLDRPAAAAPARRRVDAAGVAKVVVAASAVGLLTGFFGVGGGFVVVPALVLALRFPMPVAVGTSLLVIAVNSAAATVARLGSQGGFDWPMLGVFVASAVAGSFAGNRVASKVNPRVLTVAFSALLIVVASYMAARSVPQWL